MSATMQANDADPYRLGRGQEGALGAPGHGSGGPAAKRVIAGYGFWIFLLSDIVMFSAFFATYGVLADQTAGGPGAAQLFDLGNVKLETVCLLASSFTCGVASISAGARNRGWFLVAMLATAVFGSAFVGLELREFSGLIAQGAGPQRSGFLSGFFALVGLHGAHVTAGLVWLLITVAQVLSRGFRQDIMRRILCFSLFWHALDIVWVALFTVVYLLGVHS